MHSHSFSKTASLTTGSNLTKSPCCKPAVPQSYFSIPLSSLSFAVASALPTARMLPLLFCASWKIKDSPSPSFTASFCFLMIPNGRYDLHYYINYFCSLLSVRGYVLCILWTNRIKFDIKSNIWGYCLVWFFCKIILLWRFWLLAELRLLWNLLLLLKP